MHYVSYSATLKNVVEFNRLAVYGETFFCSNFFFRRQTHPRVLSAHLIREAANSQTQRSKTKKGIKKKKSKAKMSPAGTCGDLEERKAFRAVSK